MVAYLHPDIWGYHMCVSDVEQIETLIKWAGRLLYLEIFISLMVVMGYWHLPFTFAFIGAVGSLVYVGFVWKNKEDVRLEHDVQK